VGWLVLAAAWTFLVVALLSFDGADWPSHVVAVHNAPAANLCGRVGALVAYGAYSVIGVGVWAIVAGAAALLVLTLTGQHVGHPIVRGLGLLLVATAISCLHGLLWPTTGPLAGMHAGLLATAILGELVPRFSTFGTLLLLTAALLVGGVVAAERVVFAIPTLATRGGRALARAPRRIAAFLPALLARPAPAEVHADEGDGEAYADDEEVDDDEYEYEEEDEEEEPDGDWEYVDEDDDEDEDEEGAEDDEPVEAEAPVSARPRLTAEQLREKIAKLPLRMAGTNTTVARDEDIPRNETFEGYRFPTLELLENPESNYSDRMEQHVRDQAAHLEKSLDTYGIDGEVVGIESGPTVTQYSVQLAPGTKVAKINAIASDLARSLRAHNIRVVPNMVGKTTIGIEVPNLHREKVRLKELMSGGHARKMVLPMFLGKDAAGEPLVADLTKMPHMLIAGTTGSGKSVCINSILVSWLYTKRPDELKLVLVDPKMVEMSQFAEIPHLMCPVVTESAKAAAILEWAVDRMEERYEMLREARVRDIKGYNALSEEELYEAFGAESDEEKARIPKKMPYIVFVVDELADLMMTCKEVEQAIVRIAQKARAVGIHLILATQRPQANVVTGLIKSNMPCRVSFKVAGQGDMMFLTPSTSEIRRAQGTLMEDGEIRSVVKFLKTVAAPSFDRNLMALRPPRAIEDDDAQSHERDPMFDGAVRVMIESGRGSVSLLQRRLAIGYGRASRLVDQMALAGIVGTHKGSVAREVLITLEEWEQMKALEDGRAADIEEHLVDELS
jgi:S-DNA-T family DNA segregation ATPase FtsK/SpoIIIE